MHLSGNLVSFLTVGFRPQRCGSLRGARPIGQTDNSGISLDWFVIDEVTTRSATAYFFGPLCIGVSLLTLVLIARASGHFTCRVHTETQTETNLPIKMITIPTPWLPLAWVNNI